MRTLAGSTRYTRPACWQQAAAWCGLVLVGILNVLAVSPQAHAWVHGREYVYSFDASSDEDVPGNPLAAGADPQDHDHGEHEAGCVITQFAHGYFSHHLLALVLAPVGQLDLTRLRTPQDKLLRSVDIRLPFCCGPPEA